MGVPMVCTLSELISLTDTRPAEGTPQIPSGVRLSQPGLRFTSKSHNFMASAVPSDWAASRFKSLEYSKFY